MSSSDPRTTIHFDDARHFLATTDEKFDVITSDPINSWIRGAAALYSSEYYELCKQHLNPGGIVVQWIPLYEKDLATAKCELATFLRAFPIRHALDELDRATRRGPAARHHRGRAVGADARSIWRNCERRINANADS